MLPSAEMMGANESDSNSASSESEDVTAEASDLLAQGKRNLVCNDVPAAVECLQEACRLLAAVYGDVADEVGDAYLHYGKALLEMSRLDNGVLGNVLNGDDAPQGNEDDDVDDDDDESQADNEKTLDKKENVPPSEEKTDASTNGIVSEELPQGCEPSVEKDAEVANTKQPTESVPEATEDKAIPCESAKNEEQATVASSSESASVATTGEADLSGGKNALHKTSVVSVEQPNNGAVDRAQPNVGVEKVQGDSDEKEQPQTTSQDGDADDNDGDNVPPLQLAWEVLELAKVIYSRSSDDEMKLKAAESYQVLGEVSLESETYDQAIEDFKCCLQIQADVLGPADRQLAATHYQLGMAYNMVRRLDAAIDEFKAAKTILQDRAVILRQKLAGCDGLDTTEQNKASQEKAQNELAEVESLLPEIIAKIEDAEEEAKTFVRVDALIKESVSTTTIGFEDTASTSGSTVVANNISSLIRKKREPEVEIATEAKKLKPDEASAAKANENGAGDCVQGDSAK